MIKGLSKPQLILIAAAVLGLVLFLSAPRLPKGIDNTVTENVTTIDADVQEAVNMVQNGEQPMQGILKLRDILTKDSANTDALWHLGLFSIQSGQYENAIKRFDQVVKYDEKGKYKEAHIYLGKTYATMGDKESALKSFNVYIEIESDTSLTNRVEEMIVEVKKTS